MIPYILPEDVRAAASQRGCSYAGDAEPASLYRKAEQRRVLAAIRSDERRAGRSRQPGFAGKLRLVFRLGQ
jgi:hypothetical protein